MRLVSWNVNSIRMRLDRVLGFLDRSQTDVLAIQETKCRDDQFPTAAFEAAGYDVAHFGLSQWNGVAIASRVGLDDVATQFPGQPEVRHLEPGGLERRGGELVVPALGLLDRQDVGLRPVEKGEHTVEPRADGVDVPGDDAHADSLRAAVSV